MKIKFLFLPLDISVDLMNARNFPSGEIFGIESLDPIVTLVIFLESKSSSNISEILLLDLIFTEVC